MIHIDIVGGGSIGLLLAARLAASGSRMTLWTRTKAQRDLIRARGISLADDNCPDGRVIAAVCERLGDGGVPEEQYAMRWIVLAVKQTDIGDDLTRQLRALVGDDAERTAVVCWQNGIGHIETLAKALGDVPVYTAVTTEGARRDNGHTIRHTGHGETWIGETTDNGRKTDESRRKSQKMFVSALQKAGFAAFLSNDINNRVYQKLLINAVINPLTAMFDVLNGELPNHPQRLELMKRLHEETAAVLEKAGMRRAEDDWLRLLDVCHSTRGNTSSMLGDVRAGRTTELSSINGAVMQLAARSGMDVPLNKAVTAIIEAYNRKP